MDQALRLRGGVRSQLHVTVGELWVIVVMSAAGREVPDLDLVCEHEQPMNKG